jgi:hypothetical protein
MTQYQSELNTANSYMHMHQSAVAKLRGFGPLANYADRATAASWRSSTNFCG